MTGISHGLVLLLRRRLSTDDHNTGKHFSSSYIHSCGTTPTIAEEG
jgi:hypothetical protein